MLLGILMSNMPILNPGMRQGTGSLVQVSQDQPVATQYPGRGGRNLKADVFGWVLSLIFKPQILYSKGLKPDRMNSFRTEPLPSSLFP